MDLNPVEIRVLGCLIEKQRTTPDAYPLSLNALRAACNQATNRDPVIEYDEAMIREALTRLGRRRLTRLTSTQGSRAAKFRHLLDEALGLPADEQAVLAVLTLRGAQTPGELRARSERLHPLADAAALHEVLERLIGRDLVERLERRPGQKEERYRHRLTGAAEPAPAAPTSEVVTGTEAVQTSSAVVHPRVQDGATLPDRAATPSDERLAALERRVEELSTEVATLRTQLAELRAAAPPAP